MFVEQYAGGTLGGDEAYQTLCVKRYDESPLGLLVFWIGNLWTSAFGFEILNLRILASIEMWLSVAVTSAWCFYTTKNIRLSSVLLLLGCIVTRIGCSYIYNWDTGTYLFDAIALCLTLSILRNPNYLKFSLLGIFISLMTLGRLPSVIFLPLVIIVIYFGCKDKVKLKKLILSETILVCSFVLVFIFLTWIILKSPSKYFTLLLNGNVVSGHSPIDDGERLWTIFNVWLTALPNLWCWGILSLTIPVILIKIKSKFVKISIVFVWVLFCGLYSYWITPPQPSLFIMLGYGGSLSLGLLFAVPIYSLFSKKNQINKLTRYSLISCGLMIFSLAFGSDIFFERIGPGFLLPAIIGLLWPLKSRSFHRYLKCSLAFTLIGFTTLLSVHLLRIWILYKDTPVVSLSPFKGIKENELVYNGITPALGAIELLNDKNISYLSLFDNKTIELLTGKVSVVPLHEYHEHFLLKDYWLENKKKYIGKVQAILYIPNHRNPYIDLDFVVEDIKKEGYTKIVKVGETVILLPENQLLE